MKGIYYFSAERANVARVLLNFEFLDDSSEGSTVSGTVLSDNSDLDSSLGHFANLFLGDLYFINFLIKQIKALSYLRIFDQILSFHKANLLTIPFRYIQGSHIRLQNINILTM